MTTNLKPKKTEEINKYEVKSQKKNNTKISENKIKKKNEKK